MCGAAGAGILVTNSGPDEGGGRGRSVGPRQGDNRPPSMAPFLLAALLVLAAGLVHVAGEVRSPRVVDTRQGKLRGFIKALPNKSLRPVEVFLGVPYATPPTGSNRFSPTRAPGPWEGEREARQYGPVCPQLLPDLSSPTFPKDRLLSAQKLINYLSNQAEDCLYLNIHVPSQVVDTVGHKAFPVLVYIHGDSFEWGAANPYDGSVLAAYGEVIVVSLNYRLGPLGFLNTNADTNTRGHVMNHGLMDQIAALHWVQENIGAFGGDPGSVTLMGHGTGAACVHFLMASTAVVPGLFHRAILMSGSALSSWASVGSPTYYAIQYGRALNCSSFLSLESEKPPSNDQFDQMVNCLKDKSLDELQSVKLAAPRFLYSFGPSVDGIVIKSDFRRPVRSRPDEPSKEYDILFGVVPNEAFDDFSENDIIRGFDIHKRDRIFRTLVRNTFDYHLNEVFISAVNEYTDWEHPDAAPRAVRDATLAALSDARYVSPLLQSVAARTSPHKQHFFYVFDHQSRSAAAPAGVRGAIHGEELAYLFGAPLVGELGVFSSGEWTQQDVAVSEATITYFTNFVKTGDPNLLTGQELRINARLTAKLRAQKWRPFDMEYQHYLSIGATVAAKNHYRAHSLALWTWLVPQLQTVGRLEFLTLRAPSILERQQDDEFDPEKRLQELSVLHHLFPTHDDPALYIGGVRPLRHMAGHYITPPSTTAQVPSTSMPQPPPPPIQPLSSDVHSSNASAMAEATMPQDTVDYVAYSTALSVTVAIGVSLLILNVLIFAGVYYQRDRSRLGDKTEQQTRLSSASSSDHQMASMTGAAGTVLGSTAALDVIAKTPQSAVSSCNTIESSPFTQTQVFTHISECPPAFADTLVTFTSEAQTVLPSLPPSTLPNGDLNSMPRPPPPPRLVQQEEQTLLPANIPGPPRGKIPNCDELRV